MKIQDFQDFLKDQEVQQIPKPGRSFSRELFFSISLGIYSLLSSLFSDWVSQIISNVFGLSESKSFPLLILLIIAAISMYVIQYLLEKFDPDQIDGSSSSNKIITTGTFFSVLILIRVTNPCWSGCLPCTDDPWSPFITYSMATIPLIGAAGYSYIIEKNKSFSQYLFEDAFPIVHRRITNKLKEKRPDGKPRYITDKDVVTFFKEVGGLKFGDKSKFLQKARQKMYLYILSESEISDSNGEKFQVYLDTINFDEWKIRAIRKPS